jgi:hypothetical protein
MVWSFSEKTAKLIRETLILQPRACNHYSFIRIGSYSDLGFKSARARQDRLSSISAKT